MLFIWIKKQNLCSNIFLNGRYNVRHVSSDSCYLLLCFLCAVTPLGNLHLRWNISRVLGSRVLLMELQLNFNSSRTKQFCLTTLGFLPSHRTETQKKRKEKCERKETILNYFGRITENDSIIVKIKKWYWSIKLFIKQTKKRYRNIIR